MSTNVEFGIIDVETTGLYPYANDRIVEISVLKGNERGEILGEFTTLVNPKRDLGPTNIHGIRASDVKGAPTFNEIAGDVIDILAGTVFVGHNVRFDANFLYAEINRMGLAIPESPLICTLHLARLIDRSLPSRKLNDLCKHFGICHDEQHSAAADARASFSLLSMYIDRLGGVDELVELGFDTGPYPRAVWPAIPKSGKSFGREAAVQSKLQRYSFIRNIVSRLPAGTEIDPKYSDYVLLLDRVLEDRLISEDEAESLFSLATQLGMARENVVSAHHYYMKDILSIALEDGVITEAEKEDLEIVRALLDISQDDFQAMCKAATQKGISQATDRPREELAGKAICFTGAMTCSICGRMISRNDAERMAAEKGMIVKTAVTKKKLDILVVADPESMSTKAQKAREWGIRMIAEPVFWKMIGVKVD